MGKQEACSREKKRITAIGIRLIFFSQEQVLVRKERSAIYQKVERLHMHACRTVILFSSSLAKCPIRSLSSTPWRI